MEREPIKGMDPQEFEEKVAEAREVMLEAISGDIDDALKHFLLPGDKVAFLHEAAVFAAFIIAVKCAELRTSVGLPMDKKQPLREWWPIAKRIKGGEVDAMLLSYGREAEKARIQGSGEAVQ